MIFLATQTRPDIMLATSEVAQYQEMPTKENVTMVKQILRYLKGSVDLGIRVTSKVRSQVLRELRGRKASQEKGHVLRRKR